MSFKTYTPGVGDSLEECFLNRNPSSSQSKQPPEMNSQALDDDADDDDDDDGAFASTVEAIGKQREQCRGKSPNLDAAKFGNGILLL